MKNLYKIVFLVFLPFIAHCGAGGIFVYTATIGGTVSGLDGTVVLQNNGGDDLAVTENGSFTFPTEVLEGSDYNVTVLTQPQTQTCTVANGSGTVYGSSIDNITVTCATNIYNVGGTVSGLSDTVVLQNNGGDDKTVTADGSFTFSAEIADGSDYNVTVLAQPSTQTCSVANGSGTVNGADISDVTITCATNTYNVGGIVSGLSGTVVLQNNGGDDKTVTTDGNFTFPAAIADGSEYNATVLTQPQTQTCSVAQASGQINGADINDITVTCVTNTYDVGGTVSGLSGTVVLQNNGGDDKTITTDGSFIFPTMVDDGSLYDATVFAQPLIQLCSVTNGSGQVSGADITDITVACASHPWEGPYGKACWEVGYYGTLGATLAQCQADCEADPDCIGYSFNSTGEGNPLVANCWLITDCPNPQTFPVWETYCRSAYLCPLM